MESSWGTSTHPGIHDGRDTTGGGPECGDGKFESL